MADDKTTKTPQNSRERIAGRARKRLPIGLKSWEKVSVSPELEKKDGTGGKEPTGFCL